MTDSVPNPWRIARPSWFVSALVYSAIFAALAWFASALWDDCARCGRERAERAERASCPPGWSEYPTFEPVGRQLRR